MNRRIFHTTILIALLSIGVVALLSSCGDGKGEKAATVDGTTITVADFEARVQSTQAQYMAQGQSVPASDIETFEKEVLDSMIREIVLLAAAKSADIPPDEGVIAQQIESIRSQFQSESEYKAALEAQGFSEKSIRKQIGNDTMIQGLLDRDVFSQLVITDDQIQTFYKENPELLSTPPTVTASHILVQVAADASDKQKETAMAKIQDVQRKLAAGGDFAGLAREFSEGPSAPNGGSLGSFARGQMVKPFEDVAFSMEAGETSDLVQTQFGYHIIRVTAVNPESVVPLEDVRGQITEYLQQEQSQLAAQEYIDKLLAEAEIENLRFPEE